MTEVGFYACSYNKTRTFIQRCSTFLGGWNPYVVSAANRNLPCKQLKVIILVFRHLYLHNLLRGKDGSNTKLWKISGHSFWCGFDSKEEAESFGSPSRRYNCSRCRNDIRWPMGKKSWGIWDNRLMVNKVSKIEALKNWPMKSYQYA